MTGLTPSLALPGLALLPGGVRDQRLRQRVLLLRHQQVREGKRVVVWYLVSYKTMNLPAIRQATVIAVISCKLFSFVYHEKSPIFCCHLFLTVPRKIPVVTVLLCV